MERSHIWTLNVLFLWIGIIVAVMSSNITIGDSDNSPLRCCSSEFDENLPTFCERVFNATSNSTLYVIDDDPSGFDTSTTVVVVLFFSCISILGCVCAIGYVVFESDVRSRSIFMPGHTYSTHKRTRTVLCELQNNPCRQKE